MAPFLDAVGVSLSEARPLPRAPFTRVLAFGRELVDGVLGWLEEVVARILGHVSSIPLNRFHQIVFDEQGSDLDRLSGRPSCCSPSTNRSRPCR